MPVTQVFPAWLSAPILSGMSKAPSLGDAYDAAYRYLANSGYTAIVVREA